MNPERWESLKRLFHQALEQPPGERDRFIRDAAAGDTELRDEVIALLAAQTRGDEAFRDVGRPSTPVLLHGTRLGAYEIHHLIGVGGMGEVYQARDLKLRRDVAVKVLPASIAADADRRHRFEREAHVLASLNHPHIASIYGFEESAGIAALVLELVEGPTLADRIGQGPLPVGEALAIARQIADALDTAHERGIIHRDLKPANVKLTPDGTVKVLDFGLAKVEPAASSLTESPTITAIATREGVIAGTAPYMSPEQARGKQVDKRADIWAFGCVLYELLTGSRAFRGETTTDVLAAVVQREPDWNALPVTTPPGIRRLLMRCLDKDPKRRLRDIGDARVEMDDGFAAAPETAHRVRPTALAGVAAVATMIAIAVAIAWLRQPAVVERTVQLVIPPLDNQPFGRGPGFLSVSPDGQAVAFVAATDATRTRHMLWVRPLESLSGRPIQGTEDARHPSWSPDSRAIVFSSRTDRALKKVDAAGGTPVVLARDSAATAAWSAHDVILYTGRDGRLYRVSSRGGDSTPVSQLDAARSEIAHVFPIFLHDGRRFIFLAHSNDTDKTGLFLASLDSPDRTPLVRVQSNVALAQGHLLFQREGTLYAQPFDEDAGRLSADPIVLAERIDYNASVIPGSAGGAFSASETGTLVYRSRAGTDLSVLALFDRSGKGLTTLGSPASYLDARLSPDGRQVLVSQIDSANRATIWSIDVERGVSTRATMGTSDEMRPVLSDDGSTLFFGSRRHNPQVSDLYQREWNDPARDELLFQSPDDKRPTSLAPDGSILLFNRNMGGRMKSDIWGLALDGDRKPFAVVATPFDEGLGRFSPDGRWISYTSDESGSWQVYVQRAPRGGAKARVSTGSGGRFAYWAGDGKQIFYVTLDDRVVSVDIDTSGPTPRISLPRELFVSDKRIFSFAVDRSGSRFLLEVPLGEERERPITVVLNWRGLFRGR